MLDFIICKEWLCILLNVGVIMAYDENAFQTGYTYSCIEECYYCGHEKTATCKLHQVYEPDIDKIVMVCTDCIEAMQRGEI